MSDIITPSTTVIRDVGKSLRTLLADNIPDLDEGNIGFDSPADFSSTGAKSLSLFLLQVKINPYLRNLPQRPAPLSGGGASESTFSRPPVILDLVYMLTPFGQNLDAEVGPEALAEVAPINRIGHLRDDDSLDRRGGEQFQPHGLESGPAGLGHAGLARQGGVQGLFLD